MNCKTCDGQCCQDPVIYGRIPHSWYLAHNDGHVCPDCNDGTNAKPSRIATIGARYIVELYGTRFEGTLEAGDAREDSFRVVLDNGTKFTCRYEFLREVK